MKISIRAFSGSDMKAADILLQAAFQRPGSWVKELSMIRKLQPRGAFLAHEYGKMAGVVFSLMYPDFTYIGPLGVHPDFQRQGIGFVLMEHILGWLQQQGATGIALDASPMGQSIYENLGFVAFDEVNILQRQNDELTYKPPPGIQQLSLQNLSLITASDKKAFGTDRSSLLGELLLLYPERGFYLKDKQGNISGYLVAQEKSIGPWISQTKEDAELLLKSALSLTFSGPVSVIAPTENTEVTALLQQYGFEKVRVLRHMVRGSERPAGQRKDVYGQVSPSLG